jgi:hypothetical protein
LSKIQNVAKLTSEISSSHSVISWLIPVFGVSISAAGLPIAADAPLASDNDNPAALNTGTALMLRLRFVEACFACDIGTLLYFGLAREFWQAAAVRLHAALPCAMRQ